MCSFARAVKTKSYRLSGLNNINSLSRSSAVEAGDHASAGLVPSVGREGGSVPGLSPGLVDGRLLLVPPHRFLSHVSLSEHPFLIRTQSYGIRAHPIDLILT